MEFLESLTCQCDNKIDQIYLRMKGQGASEEAEEFFTEAEHHLKQMYRCLRDIRNREGNVREWCQQFRLVYITALKHSQGD